MLPTVTLEGARTMRNLFFPAPNDDTKKQNTRPTLRISTDYTLGAAMIACVRTGSDSLTCRLSCASSIASDEA